MLFGLRVTFRFKQMRTRKKKQSVLIFSTSFLGTGIHRYNFLVFDEGTKAKDYSSVIPMDLVDIGRRVYWNLAEQGKKFHFFFCLFLFFSFFYFFKDLRVRIGGTKLARWDH